MILPPNLPHSDTERASYLVRDLRHLPADARRISTFLDMGAGSGSMSAVVATLYPEARGVLVDIKDRLTLKELLPGGGMERLQGFGWPATEQLRGKSFDLVLSMDVLEHIPKWKEALEDLIRYVAPGGYLYIQAPSNYPSPNWPTTKMWLNAIKGLMGRQNPALHVRHGLSCKRIYDACRDQFSPIIAAEDYVLDGRVFCDFKPRTHVLLQKKR